MLPMLIDSEMTKQKLSFRSASTIIGISHTTLIRIIKGKPVDLPTLTKVCRWLEIDPAEILGLPLQEPSENGEKITNFITLFPDLEKELASAIDKIADEKLDPAIINDVLDYLAFKLSRVSNS